MRSVEDSVGNEARVPDGMEVYLIVSLALG